MNTKKYMMRAIICLMLFTAAAGIAAPAYTITAVSEPTYSPDPPLPGNPCDVSFNYVFSCPINLGGGGAGSTPYTLDNIQATYKIGAGSYQSIAIPPTSCTIQCPQPSPPLTCNIQFQIPIPTGSDCKSLTFAIGGTVGAAATFYKSNAITIGTTTGSCSTPSGGGEKPKADPSKPISAGSVFDPDQTFRCENINDNGFPGCNYDFGCGPMVSNNRPIVRCKDCNDCQRECAKACGTNTLWLATATKDCETGCEDNTCNKYTLKYDLWTCLATTKPDEQEACACLNACIGECDANTAFCNVINIMRILALLAAAIMIAIHALRLIMSQEPADRKNAKESIWFVILGTLIIIIASGLVGYLYVGGVVC